MKKMNIAVLTLAIAAVTGIAIAQTAPAARPKIDANNDGIITREEAAKAPGLAARFDALDKNKDGRLSADERPQRGEHGMRDGKRGEGHGMWQKLDTNKDGRISKAEAAADPQFAARFAEDDANKDGFVDRTDMQQRMQAKRDEWFAAADANRDGKLSQAELTAAHERRMAEHAQQRKDMQAQHFAQMDTNKDGYITKDELKNAPMGGTHGMRGPDGKRGMLHEKGPAVPPPVK